MSRRLDISSLLCNDETTPEPTILSPQLRYSNAREPQRSPSPGFTSSSRTVPEPLPHPGSYAQNPLSTPYSTTRNPPIASHTFNPLHALVHAATEERRRLSGGSPGTSPPDSAIHGYSRQYQQSTTPLPRSNQSPPVQHYSHSSSQQSASFQGPSPVSSPIHPFQSPPLSVRSPALSPHQFSQAHQRFPGRSYPPFERTPSVPSPTLDSYHSHYPKSLPTEAYHIQRQQVEHDYRNYELQSQRQHQERTYRDEHPHSIGRVETYHTTSPTISPTSHLPFTHAAHESISYPRPPSSRGSLNEPTTHRSDRPTERDRSSIHDLCLPTKPSPPPRLPQPLPSSPPSSNKRRYSDTHGPSPYQSQSQISPTPREDLSHDRPAHTPSDVSSPRLDSAPHHVERKYLGLAEMMSPVEDRRLPINTREAPRSEPTPVVSAPVIPPRKRTPPGSSEGRAKAMKNMGDFSRSSFAAPGIQASTSYKGSEDKNQHVSADDKLYSRPSEESVRMPEQIRKPDSSSESLASTSIKPRSILHSPPEALPTASSPSIPRSYGEIPSVEDGDAPLTKAQRASQDVPASLPSHRPKSKHERIPGSGAEKAHVKKTESPPIIKPALSENLNHQRRHHSPPKVQKLLSSGAVPSSRSSSSKGKNNDDDAHEWFLEQFDDAPPVRPPSRPPSSKAHDDTASRKPVSKKRSSSGEKLPRSPVNDTLPIDQELEALVSGSPVVTKTETPNDYDMDVDLAVDQLVAETLNDGDSKVEENTMEIDVDNELLSLVEEPALQEDQGGSRHTRPPAEDAAATTSPVVAQPTPKPVDRISMDRASMPPPSVLPQSKESKEVKERDDKHIERELTQTPPLPAKKKKEAAKASTKSKATPTGSTAIPVPAKSRPKASTKAKPKVSDSLAVPPAATKPKAPGTTKKVATSRSRSASVKPGGEAVEPQPPQEEEQAEEEPEEDKLYCVCKTKYDEDKNMIACDKCDEWYHTQCVQMPDLEVDLVDQFICPPCIEKHPDLNLRTTYKPRCLFGLIQENPDSADACHKPARGSFSKYCSDECGVSYMQLRLTTWSRKGGKKDTLWESVKGAQPREGVVVRAPGVASVHESSKSSPESERGVTSARTERDIDRLNKLLDSIVKLREETRKGLDIVQWREKLITYAADRAEQVGECGWDQRLCFGDVEWADFGSGVLETYDEAEKDETHPEGFGAWWCPGKTACDRHSGWQTLRYREITLEKEQIDDALHNLTTREREIRKRIEDLLAPQSRKGLPPPSPSKSSSSKHNGISKMHGNGTNVKRTKKRKAPS